MPYKYTMFEEDTFDVIYSATTATLLVVKEAAKKANEAIEALKKVDASSAEASVEKKKLLDIATQLNAMLTDAALIQEDIDQYKTSHPKKFKDLTKDSVSGFLWDLLTLLNDTLRITGEAKLGRFVAEVESLRKKVNVARGEAAVSEAAKSSLEIFQKACIALLQAFAEHAKHYVKEYVTKPGYKHYKAAAESEMGKKAGHVLGEATRMADEYVVTPVSKAAHDAAEYAESTGIGKKVRETVDAVAKHPTTETVKQTFVSGFNRLAKESENAWKTVENWRKKPKPSGPNPKGKAKDEE
jgi:molecular chaperone GrpE (heat shock protein)